MFAAVKRLVMKCIDWLKHLSDQVVVIKRSKLEILLCSLIISQNPSLSLKIEQFRR